MAVTDEQRRLILTTNLSHRQLGLSKGTVSGIRWRAAHPEPPRPRKRNKLRIHPAPTRDAILSLFSTGNYYTIPEIQTELNSTSSSIRKWITWLQEDGTILQVRRDGRFKVFILRELHNGP